MTEVEPKKGESVKDYIQRCMKEMNVREPIIAHISTKINGIKTEKDYDEFVEITKCEFTTYESENLIDIDALNAGRTISFSFDAQPIDPKFLEWSYNQARFVETKPNYHCTNVRNHKYRKKTYAPKLKRLMR